MNNVRIAIVNAGISDPSSTRLLADRIAQKTIDALHAAGTTASVRSVTRSRNPTRRRHR